MLKEIWERFETIEECYELMLAYAAQGLPNELGSQSGGQVREFLNGAVEALDGLAETYAAAIREENLEGADRFPAFLFYGTRRSPIGAYNWAASVGASAEAALLSECAHVKSHSVADNAHLQKYLISSTVVVDAQGIEPWTSPV